MTIVAYHEGDRVWSDNRNLKRPESAMVVGVKGCRIYLQASDDVMFMVDLLIVSESCGGLISRKEKRNSD